MMNRREFLLAATCAGLSVPLLSCTAEPKVVQLASGEPGGFQAAFADLLAASTARNGAAVTIQVQNTNGSVRNLEMLADGGTDLGLSLADAAADAATRMSSLRAIGRVYANYVQLAVAADSGLRSFDDLRGKPVSLGAKGSGTEATGLRLLAAIGLAPEDVILTPVSLTTVLDSLADGTVAAAMWAGGVPTPAAIPRPGYGPPAGIRLIDLGRAVRPLRERYGPTYEPVSLAPGLYGADNPETPTIGIPSLLVTTSALADEVASAIVDTLIGQASALIPEGTAGAQFLDGQSLIQTYGVPLHPGARAAFQRQHG
ncbi:TRAP transporter substrate-binding protein [Rhodococcus sp. 06-156-3C]|uniref:TAXI family TRAP transporter solute-binding subunit n=1 Tax=Nocardiaceae TaxID=85025 RepID=UPI00052304A0|nr:MULTISPECIES: TAXI family TRAP transporter solute-binding subunit [Rhodococcus]OZD08709.1 TRAP transporter substrate-binding protein [Rhodococcus sp. 06-156-4C]OZD17287.1 TRAP transporter substrate-binding protein [Rhodococcus sp. 06-156-3C]OZD18624.1 TRAP transporter substrate-binding protein [Rhodococcus sp. 06-156-4a]OZD25031.1 TRAP transporter substrate-binding protein [Rhodococcus sp. 06-156-3b]OZD34189.1 TRAP transporter substrate-binding protein [Rhodococcus sp. 06-156-3]